MKILVATDGSNNSISIIEMVNNLDLTPEDEIKVITIVDMAVPMAVDMYAGYLASTTEIEQNLRDNAKKIIDDCCMEIKNLEEFRELNITSKILTGSPESRIVETAEEMKADLIIVGSHGYNRWERLLLGSVSDSVVHHAPCSVLVVRN